MWGHLTEGWEMESNHGRGAYPDGAWWTVSSVCMCIGVCVCTRAQLLSCIWLFATPWIMACQAPLSMEFSRQEYWSGFPFPPSGDLPNPGIKPTSLVPPVLTDGFFTTTPPGKSLSSLGKGKWLIWSARAGSRKWLGGKTLLHQWGKQSWLSSWMQGPKSSCWQRWMKQNWDCEKLCAWYEPGRLYGQAGPVKQDLVEWEWVCLDGAEWSSVAMFAVWRWNQIRGSFLR